jgi:hypothetical protein
MISVTRDIIMKFHYFFSQLSHVPNTNITATWDKICLGKDALIR